MVTLPSNDRPRLGFVGLGIMGSPMAGHLAAAGFALCAFDIDRAAAERLEAHHPGVTVADSAAAVGAAADIVLTMLPDGHEVQRAVLGPDGLAETMGRGALLLDTSSAQPWLTLETAAALAEQGVAMVDAPVSGAQWGAERAELVFMVGGNEHDLARVRPILDVLGRAVFHLGPLGCGHVMKSINNTITAMTLLATSEGLVLGKRAGLDPAAMNARPERIDRRFLGHPEPHRAADPQPDLRRPLQARADDEGHRHRHAAGAGPRARRSPMPSSAIRCTRPRTRRRVPARASASSFDGSSAARRWTSRLAARISSIVYDQARGSDDAGSVQGDRHAPRIPEPSC